MDYLRDFFSLVKIRITSMVMVTTAFGYLLAKGFDFWLFPCLLGTWLLAMGSAALNHWQDKEIDEKMQRTKERPLPAKRLKDAQVLTIAFLLIFSGSGLLLLYSLLPFLLGLLALLWYNGIYTYGKRWSPFFVIPGSLIGAIPPLMGWFAGSGTFSLSFSILFLTTFLFFWQIPHFWLILLLHYEDYQILWPHAPSKAFFGKATFLSTLFPVCLACFFPFYRPLPWAGLVFLCLITLLLLFFTFPLWRSQEKAKVRCAFLLTNFYPLGMGILLLLRP